MLEMRRGLDLGQEPRGADDGRELGSKHLDGDFALVSEIAGEVDGGHSALAELALDPVAVGKGGGEMLHRGHRAPPRRRRSSSPQFTDTTRCRSRSTGWTMTKLRPSGATSKSGWYDSVAKGPLKTSCGAPTASRGEVVTVATSSF